MMVERSITPSQRSCINAIEREGFQVRRVRMAVGGVAHVFSEVGPFKFRHDIGRGGRCEGPILRNPGLLQDEHAALELLRNATRNAR